MLSATTERSLLVILNDPSSEKGYIICCPYNECPNSSNAIGLQCIGWAYIIYGFERIEEPSHSGSRWVECDIVIAHFETSD